MVLANKNATGLFLAAIGLMLATGFAITQSSYYAENRSLLALAITCDLTLLVPLLYSFWARRNRVAAITVIPVFVLSLLIASLIIPRPQQQYLDFIKFSLVPIEIFAAGYLVIKIRRVRRHYRMHKAGVFDFLETLRASLLATLGRHRATEILTTELSVLYYAFFSWRTEREVPENTETFTYHQKCGYPGVVALFVFLIMIETFALHLLLSRFSPVLAWVFSGLSVYALVFLLGDFIAVKKRPLYFSEDAFVLRLGLRWRATLPLSQIASWEKARRTCTGEKSLRLEAVLFGSPNFIIRLRRPVTAFGLYGLKKNFAVLFLCLDDPTAFEKILQTRIGGRVPSDPINSAE